MLAKEEAECWYCGEKGHLRKDCQQETKLSGVKEQQAVCPVRAQNSAKDNVVQKDWLEKLPGRR